MRGPTELEECATWDTARPARNTNRSRQSIGIRCPALASVLETDEAHETRYGEMSDHERHGARGGNAPTETWEAEVAALERAAAATRRPDAPVVFTGSSSIRMWPNLERDMSPLPVVNVGFGGAQMDAVLHYVPRIVLPWTPRAVVLCAGENDMEPHRGKTPEDVLLDCRRFADLLSGSAPLAKLFVLSVKLSPARRDSWPAIRQLNSLLKTFCEEDDRRLFVDLTGPGLDAAGNPRDALFREDGLHLSRRGYALWTSILRPILVGGTR